MLYNLIQVRRGKQTVVMAGDLPSVRDRMRQLRASQRNGIRGSAVAYRVEPAPEGAEKFKQPPHNPHISGGWQKPARRVRKNR